jgi:hypothetical protein
MKSRKICAALVAVLSLVSVSAQAEWIQVTKHAIYNTERIFDRGDIRYVFLRINSDGNVRHGHHDYEVSREAINCAEGTAATQAVTGYRKNGKVVYSYDFPSYRLNLSPIMPDSEGDAILKVVCGIR